MKTFFVTAFLLSAFFSFACLNEDYVNKQGKHTAGYFAVEGISFYKTHNLAQIEANLKELQAKNPKTADEKRSVQNDIAVQYIKLGMLKEAATILEELIKAYPDNYSINANLGTLYELQGKNKEALQLIKKSVALNPDSHQASEWFHVKVLEYKLKNIPADKILNQDILALRQIKGEREWIAEGVRYQLTERIPFTPAPDVIMAKILQEYGDYLADSISIRAAYIMYEIGAAYDKNNLFKFAEKKTALKPYFKKYHEAVPVTGSYYLDKFLPAEDIDKVKATAKLVTVGVNFFKDQREKREAEEKRAAERKQYFLFGAIGLVVILAGLFLYKRKKQTV